MRKLATVLMALGMAAALAGCGSKESAPTTAASAAPAPESKTEAPASADTSADGAESENKKPVPSGKPLIIGTMPNHVGIPVHQADVAGYFKDAGLDVMIEIFATGAPINEAMAAGSLDVAVSGMASVYNLATGMYTYVGDGTITNGGDGIYARPDSPIALAERNEKGVLKDKELLRGVQILGPLATVGHYQATKYMEAVGLTSNDYNMVAMDFAQAYQAFIAGEGDLIAVTVPYSTQLEAAGYVKVCDMTTISDSPIIDTVYVQNKVAEERQDDLELFLECYYKACEDLMKDKDMRRQLSLDWYTSEGINTTDADMDRELQVKEYYSIDTIDPDKIGQFMVELGKFYSTQDMVAKEDVPKIEASVNNTFLKNIKARAAQK